MVFPTMREAFSQRSCSARSPHLTSLPSALRCTLPSTTGDLRASAWAYLRREVERGVLGITGRDNERQAVDAVSLTSDPLCRP